MLDEPEKCPTICPKINVNDLINKYYKINNTGELQIIDLYFISEESVNDKHTLIYDVVSQFGKARVTIEAGTNCDFEVKSFTEVPILESFSNGYNWNFWITIGLTICIIYVIMMYTHSSKNRILKGLSVRSNDVSGFIGYLKGLLVPLSVALPLTLKEIIGVVIFILIIAAYILESQKKEKKVEIVSKHENAVNICRTPVLNSEKCWKTEHQNCNYEMRPGDPDRLRQCVNNNLNFPNNLKGKCNGRVDLVTKPIDRISQSCYSKQMV